MSAPRCTNAEAEARLTQTIGWLIRGHNRRSILQMASDAWGVGERQIDNYLTRAYTYLREENEKEREELTARGIAQRDDLYRLARDTLDELDPEDRAPFISAARAVLTDRDRLLALYATDRASLARAGLDKALAESGLAASAEELRAVLTAGAQSRAARGLDTDTRDDDAEYVTLPGTDDADDDEV